ncbi:helicase-related protein [Periweissella fabalis]|uniref:helicase-related protein n=1 Tax=Periweissella fabalis TaxID=1070421 RepID=UPI003B848088
MQLIKQLVSEGKKVMVWGMFVGTMRKIQKELQREGISANRIYGQTLKQERVGLIDEFRDGNVQVMISNPATLGESISLHKTVHDAVYFEYNFNLTFMLQSRDRIHRLGLADDQYTRYYYLMTEGTKSKEGFIDARVYERLKEKEVIMMYAYYTRYQQRGEQIDKVILIYPYSDMYTESEFNSLVATELGSEVAAKIQVRFVDLLRDDVEEQMGMLV